MALHTGQTSKVISVRQYYQTRLHHDSYAGWDRSPYDGNVCVHCCSSFGFEWPVNLAIANPREGGSSLMIVVGDDTDAFVMDLRTRNYVHRLKGHLDYSFAASWHPFDGHTVATGNQVGALEATVLQTVP